MRVRLACGAVLASLAVAISVMGQASAVVTKVGGGASTFEVTASGSALAATTVSDPSAVVLPETGSEMPITGSLPETLGGSPIVAIQGVSIKAGYVSTVGTLRGTPYAQSSAVTTGVSISGSSISTIQTECIWDLSGSKGSTTVVDALGRSFMPRPNTRVNIPGGYIILNEQTYGTTPDGAQVIVVKGAHIVFVQSVLGVQSVSGDVSLSISSCDPLRPPSLTGLFD